VVHEISLRSGLGKGDATVVAKEHGKEGEGKKKEGGGWFFLSLRRKREPKHCGGKEEGQDRAARSRARSLDPQTLRFLERSEKKKRKKKKPHAHSPV